LSQLYKKFVSTQLQKQYQKNDVVSINTKTVLVGELQDTRPVAKLGGGRDGQNVGDKGASGISRLWGRQNGSLPCNIKVLGL